MKRKDFMSMYSMYFKPEEFDSPDKPGSGLRHMKQEFMDKLFRARKVARIPFFINSGYRTKKHNKKIGGYKNSSHLKGLAADIRCKTNESRVRILMALIKAGFTRMGIDPVFIHADSDKSKPARIWLYDKKHKVIT